ncbi:hypothetical protein GLAREA_06505 [Glarea lozoyensis ATCC 20868]|uniref:DUF7907 domain-containing protein n=1 Tax=Glarea lozoyensis (strain ATCC 20868 / MF5171) TaxID=1116229 RepID=S3D4W0_GLAL2|nr:uncharacterized protein GLAREA_06505 [Glarea lozoyensis ATCC 20868]EPE33492.1 hypothetical protein GLAREA_06505 [Glarea lozoyensis ATCC 20868]
MASGSIKCTYPTDAGALAGNYYSFHARVTNSTNAIYNDLYLSVLSASPTAAHLTPEALSLFWLAGNTQQSCTRSAPLCTVVDGRAEYCLNINPNTGGLAAVRPVEVVGGVFFTTDHFYVESEEVPLGYWIENQGGYFACTDGFGEISVYYRLSTASTPRGCSDISLKILH